MRNQMTCMACGDGPTMGSSDRNMECLCWKLEKILFISSQNDFDNGHSPWHRMMKTNDTFTRELHS